jgi:predicted glycosyltransferase
MKVSFYCQHVLGIGHFHRSLEICKTLAARHPTTLILGGPPVSVDDKNIQTVLLPGLEMDPEFQALTPCDPSMILNEVQEKRREMLFDHLREEKPDILVTELYPFGRKAFRFELEPLLAAIRTGLLPECLCCSSVRDILVEKTDGREKFERKAVQALNGFFDGILVHADPEIITLDATFARLADIRIPIRYTGFVTRSGTGTVNHRIRERLKLSPMDKLIVASIGGGNVGSELLFAVVKAFASLRSDHPVHLQLFCGPYCDEHSYRQLKDYSRANIGVERFTDQFPAWLETADLSISMAGYNTCMNLLQAGIPALVYPYKQNREQRLRAEKIGVKAPISVLDDNDLAPGELAGHMHRQLLRPRTKSAINLNGAMDTVRQLETWYNEKRHA